MEYLIEFTCNDNWKFKFVFGLTEKAKIVILMKVLNLQWINTKLFIGLRVHKKIWKA